VLPVCCAASSRRIGGSFPLKLMGPPEYFRPVFHARALVGNFLYCTGSKRSQIQFFFIGNFRRCTSRARKWLTLELFTGSGAYWKTGEMNKQRRGC